MTELFRVFHVIGAVVLIGELLYAGLWLARAVARGEEGLRVYVLATMAWTSKSYALPAILINLLTGIALLHFRHVPLRHALWLWVALALYAVATWLWHGALIPRRKKMAALYGEPEKGSARLAASGEGGHGTFDALAHAWLRLNGLAVFLFFVILALMVWRPTI